MSSRKIEADNTTIGHMQCSIGDFHNVFKFHAYSVNKRLFLMAAKLVRGLSDVATTNVIHAKWIPAIEITLKEAGE